MNQLDLNGRVAIVTRGALWYRTRGRAAPRALGRAAGALGFERGGAPAGGGQVAWDSQNLFSRRIQSESRSMLRSRLARRRWVRSMYWSTAPRDSAQCHHLGISGGGMESGAASQSDRHVSVLPSSGATHAEERLWPDRQRRPGRRQGFSDKAAARLH
jgi:hypothetical protein